MWTLAEEITYYVSHIFFPIHIFYRQLDFSSEPEVANEILENEPKSYLIIA